MEQIIDPAGDFYSDTSTSRTRQSGAVRAFSGVSSLFGYAAGEQYLRSKVMISMMHSMKLKDANGKEISAWDAFEVVEEKHEGKTIGSKVQLKEGVTKLDGSEFTTQDLIDLRLKVRGVNQKLNGAMNEDDKGAIHQYALGRATLQFRQWMVKHISRRYAGKHYDTYLGEYQEGYMRTLFGIVPDIFKGHSLWYQHNSNKIPWYGKVDTFINIEDDKNIIKPFK